jgi:hypothetical protein
MDARGWWNHVPDTSTANAKPAGWLAAVIAAAWLLLVLGVVTLSFSLPGPASPSPTGGGEQVGSRPAAKR